MKNIVYYISILILISPSIAASQNSNQGNEKVMPLVKYNPVEWISVVQNSFCRLPHTDYIKIVETKNQKSYFINLGQDEKKISNRAFPLDGIIDKVNTDSLFLLYFFENPHGVFQGKIPVKYYGILENNKIIYYKNEKGKTNVSLSLEEVINEEFGSIDKFKELASLIFNNQINLNIRNGLYSEDKEVAIHFLKTDYEFYEQCFPNDESTTMELFFEFLEKYIELEKAQKEKIKEMILEEKGQSEDINTIWREPYRDNRRKMRFSGRDISHILLQVLTKNQFTCIIEKNEIREYLKKTYLRGALRLGYINLPDGDFLIPTEEQELEYAKEQVFGK